MTTPRPNLDACKLLAVLLMVVDHVGLLVMPEALGLRLLGRLAFPLFACCLGYNWMHHSKDRAAYARRLWLMAAIAQPVYMLTVDTWQLNIFATLAAGLTLAGWSQSNTTRQAATLTGLMAWAMLEGVGLGPIVSYGPAGVLAVMLAAWGCWTSAAVAVALANFATLDPVAVVMALAAASAVGLFLASRRMSWQPPAMRARWFWYSFYPVHLVAIAGIAGLTA